MFRAFSAWRLSFMAHKMVHWSSVLSEKAEFICCCLAACGWARGGDHFRAVRTPPFQAEHFLAKFGGRRCRLKIFPVKFSDYTVG